MSQKTKFSTLIISDLILLYSFILSHPLYFLYFIFFSSYILQILSFLCPLFVTTTLLIIALVENFSPTSPVGSVSFLQSVYHAIVEKLHPKMADEEQEEEFHSMDALEVFKTVFDTSVINFNGFQVDGFEENPKERILQTVESSVLKISHQNQDYDKMEMIQSVKKEHRFEDFLEQLDEFESVKSIAEEKKVEPPSKKVNRAIEKQKEVLLLMNGDETTRECAKKGNHKNYFPKEENSLSRDYDIASYDSRSLEYDIASYGSTRREKEWKRTLACKLFEERNNGDGIEGMDSLWEKYELNSMKGNSINGLKKRDKSKRIECNEDHGNDDADDDEVVGQLCCLQAFKFSAGKMNLGVGKHNLARISKAVKGIGWLQRVRRQDKKVHSGDALRFP